MSGVPGGSQPPLLPTKLYMPRMRTQVVTRGRLLERMDDALMRKLTLVCAPGGFGKTALLSQWLEERAAPVPAGWVNLTDADNDPVTFWFYLAAALERVQVGLGQDLQQKLCAAGPGAPEGAWVAFINAVSQCSGDFILVLDDYHVITDPTVHQAVGQLVEYMPPYMHLVVSGRADPPLALARLRAAGELNEVRVQDLRFEPEETEAFLNGAKSLSLRPDQLAALQDRTEGWVAGLQMAALSMAGRTDVDSFVSAFTGSHRFIVDYLGEEVLERQPEAVRRFLIHTAVLDRLTGPLYDQVTGEPGGTEMLNQLEHENLFIAPLDDQREWYRYHQLFADVLRARLRSREPELEPVLHRRARDWFEAAGQPREAIGHALGAGDPERAANLVEQCLEDMMSYGERQTVLGWLEALPHTLVTHRPKLAIAYAQCLVESGRTDLVEGLLTSAESGLDGFADPSAQRTMRGEVAAVRSYMYRVQMNLDDAVRFARQALELLPESEVGWRSNVTLMLAGAFHQMGRLPEAAEVYAETAALSHQAGNLFVEVVARCLQAKLLEQQGAVAEAMALYDRALQACDEQGAAAEASAAAAHVHLAMAYCERYEVEQWDRHAAAALRLAERSGQVEAEMYAYLYLAFAEQARGNTTLAREWFARLERVATPSVEWTVRVVHAYGVQLALLAGQTDEAAAWLAIYADKVTDSLAPPFDRETLTLLYALLATGKPAAALERIQRLLPIAEAAGQITTMLTLQAAAALAWYQLGHTDQALSALRVAVANGESTGFVRPFLIFSRPMATLLQLLPHYGSNAFVRRVLAALGEEEAGVRTDQPLLEPLSDRELEVLRLVAAGASNQEIANRLFIALTTVKKHVGNIFGKLRATNRVQAVARARELGLR